MKLSKEVTAAYERARRHDPLLLHAYQGDDRQVIDGFLALTRKGLPAWQKIAESGDEPVSDRVLSDFAAALQEAGVHDLALAAKGVLAARHKRYMPEDHEFLAASLKKLAPGPATEATLQKLAGEAIAVRQLMAPAPEKPKNAGDFEVKQLVLYVRPQEIGARVGENIEPYADFMKKVSKTSGSHFAGLPKGPRQTMLLIVGLKPGNKARYWYTFSEGGVKDEALAALTKKLDALAAPDVKRPMLAAFQIDLWSGPEKPVDGPPPESLHFPKEWRDAAKAKGVTLRIPLDDDDLKLIWP